MFMKIKKIIKAIFFNEKTKTSLDDKLKWISYSDSSGISKLSVSVRNPLENKKYIEIGENCQISGNFIFEVQEGKITIGNRTFIGDGTFICIDEIDFKY